MRYWDTSALVPLIVEEAGSARVRRWAADDPRAVTWAMTRLEFAAAVERRVREGAISRSDRRAALARLDDAAAEWSEVADLSAVRARAIALCARHALRAADAAQLGAALVAAEDDPASLPFVCLDARLAEAAEREGFRVLGGRG